jgi:hypothetical protein
VQELEAAKERYSFRIVRFYDDIFPYEVSWLEQFSSLYRDKVGLPFVCYLHPGLVNERRLSLLKKAGCSEIRLGVQTLNPEIRKNVLHRSETNLSIEEAIVSVKKNGIKVVTENILGLPREKDSDVIEMMRFYNSNRPTRNHYFWLRYYPGLEITAQQGSLRSEPGMPEGAKVFTQGGDTFKTANRKLIVALHLLPLFPKGVVRFMIGRKLWRFLPAWSPLWFLNFLANITSRSDSDKIWRSSTAKRYLAFMTGLS